MKSAISFTAAFILLLILKAPALADFDPYVDYSEVMIEAAVSGDYEAGILAQSCRNEKIEALELDEPMFEYDDLLLLGRLIHTEAGSAWLTEEWRMAVGEVALNRVASPEFPDSLQKCVFQPGQYSAADEDFFEILTPYHWCVVSACNLLRGERVLDEPSVVFQSGATQGSGVFLELSDSVYGSTYFCISGNPELY